jgi:glycolate oxidase
MDKFLKQLQVLYPSRRIYLDGARLAAYESDALTAYRAKPRAVVLPESQAEVVATLQLCNEHEVPFVARGSGTSLSGGSLPVEDGIVIALNRMNRIKEIRVDDRIAVVEPGAINIQVSESARQYGLYYAPDPSSQKICTIGGNVAFNAGGAHCLKYGMTSNHVLGATAVLPDGEVVEIGMDCLDRVGPDGMGFYCGNEGLFGVAVEFRLRLLPVPQSFQTVLAAYHSIEDAGETVSRIIASGLLPGAIEIMDRLAMDAAEAAVNAGYPKDAAAVLIVELDGESETVDEESLVLMKIIGESAQFDMRVAQSATERANIWIGRKSAFSAVGRLSPDFIVQDGVVPRGRLSEALRRISDLAVKYDLRVANVFHAGDGNLHPLILFDGRVAGELERAEDLAGEILQLCIDMGGSITGEHGIGMEKKSFMDKMFNADDIAAFNALRQAIDARIVSNRDKML